MSQVNLNKTGTFQVPFLGAKAYGFDISGNPVMVNEDGSVTILGIATATVQNIVANLGVGAVSGLPTSFNTGDIYVTWDTKKVYTALDAVQWGIQDLKDNQLISDVSKTFVDVYQYKNGFIYSIGLTSGTQVITGEKTFQTFPKTPESAPVSDYEVANRRFVLDTAGGLWDDRGNFDASGNVFPSTGGSGSAGSIKKADIWTISVGGTLGGVAVVEGQTVRALVDTPGQTAGNWAISAGTLVNDINAIHTDKANEIHSLTEKTTLDDNDEIVGETSTGGLWTKIRIKLSSIKAYIGLLFSTDVTELKAAGTASLGVINKLPKIDHVHPLSNKIIYGGQTVEIPGTTYIISTSALNQGMDIPLGQSLTQSFRNEMVNGGYLPVFNAVGVWMYGFSIITMELFRGGVDGVLLDSRTRTMTGNGTWYYFNPLVIQAAPLEVFTVRITRTGISNTASVSKASPSYPYANAVLNGVTQSSSMYFEVSANSVSYTEPVHTVEVDANGILFKINGADAFRIDENGLFKSLTTNYENLVTNNNDIPNKKWVLDNSGKEVYNTYIVGATPFAAGWLSLTVGGAALTPQAEKIYIVLTDGEYKNFQYRWTGTAYESIGGGGTSSNALLLDQTTEQTILNGSPKLSEGVQFKDDVNYRKLSFNSHDMTLEVEANDDVTLQLNQEQTIPVLNLSGATIGEGSFFRIVGFDAPTGYDTIEVSDNSSAETAIVDGMLTQTLIDGANGLGTTKGFVRDLNTSGATGGGLVYLGTNGAYTHTKPSYPNKVVVCGKYSKIDAVYGRIYVDVSSSYQTVIDDINSELHLKSIGNPGIAQEQYLTATDIVIDTTALTLTIATVKNGQAISAANPIRFYAYDSNGALKEFEKTSAVVFNFTNTTGVWYFYFNNAGTAIASQTVWSDFSIIAPIYRFYWNATLSGANRLVVESLEFHPNDISASDHAWKHAQGSIWVTGLEIFSNALTSGAPNADGRNTCISLSSGVCNDDNLPWQVVNSSPNAASGYFSQDLGVNSNGSLTSSNSGQFKIRTNDVNGLLDILPATRFPFLWNTGNNRPQYLTTAGVATDVPDDTFFVYYLYNLADRKVGSTIKLVSAQTNFANITDARAHSWEVLRGLYPTLRDNEIRPLYKLIFYVNHTTPSAYDAACKYTVLREYLDIRKITTSAGGQLSGSVAAANVTTTAYDDISGTNLETVKQQLADQRAKKTDIMKSRLETFSTTVTAAGTTVLTVSSNYMQFFTGSTTQTIVLPDVTTLVLGFQFFIRNLSSGILTVNSSGGNQVCQIASNCEALITCIAITGTGASSWDKELSVITSISVGDFTGAYAGLATESNWVNNFCNSVSGVSPDIRFGTFGNGEQGFAMFSQSGWERIYSNEYITNATLIAALETTVNWTEEGNHYYYVASTGDLGQKYYGNGIEYECVDGITHRWLKHVIPSTTITDATFIPYTQVSVGVVKGSAIVIPAKADIASIRAEAETTTAGNINIVSTAGTQEISQLVISAGCTSNGNVTITLDGISFTVALTTAQNTTALVATAIRNASFVSGSQIWTTGGSSATVTFTSNLYKTATDATYSAGTTGASGTMTTTTQGVDSSGTDIVASTSLPTSIGTGKMLTYIENPDFPTSSNRTVYVNIDSAASVKLQLVIQKKFA